MFSKSLLFVVTVMTCSFFAPEADAQLNYRFSQGNQVVVRTGGIATNLILNTDSAFTGTTTVCIVWRDPDGTEVPQTIHVRPGARERDIFRHLEGQDASTMLSLVIKNTGEGVARGNYRLSG